jgi:putative ABC transport system ATP-binding protein
MPPVLECLGVCKTYGQGALAEDVLIDVSLSLERGQACVLLGPSGSGKTTLLSILGCLLCPSAGELRIDGRTVDHRWAGALTALRRRSIGFVFQHAQLLPFLTMEENVAVVGRNAAPAGADLGRRVGELLERLGIDTLRHKKPHQASGGQCQRVAIARALVHRPPILLADEPTAALDWANGETVIRLLIEQARREGALLIAVTHDTRMVPWFDRVFHLDSGRLSES